MLPAPMHTMLLADMAALCCHKAVASTGRVVAGDQCEGKYTEEPWLVSNADGFTCSDASL
jgi:hypothetical protein